MFQTGPLFLTASLFLSPLSTLGLLVATAFVPLSASDSNCSTPSQSAVSEEVGTDRDPRRSLTSHCHHQHDSCIHMGSDVSYFIVSFLVGEQRHRVTISPRTSISGTFVQTLPELVTSLKGHSFSPRSCPPTLSTPAERFGY